LGVWGVAGGGLTPAQASAGGLWGSAGLWGRCFRRGRAAPVRPPDCNTRRCKRVAGPPRAKSGQPGARVWLTVLPDRVKVGLVVDVVLQLEEPHGLHDRRLVAAALRPVRRVRRPVVARPVAAGAVWVQPRQPAEAAWGWGLFRRLWCWRSGKGTRSQQACWVPHCPTAPARGPPAPFQGSTSNCQWGLLKNRWGLSLPPGPPETRPPLLPPPSCPTARSRLLAAARARGASLRSRAASPSHRAAAASQPAPALAAPCASAGRVGSGSLLGVEPSGASDPCAGVAARSNALSVSAASRSCSSRS
jgi:hypothetical protein